MLKIVLVAGALAFAGPALAQYNSGLVRTRRRMPSRATPPAAERMLPRTIKPIRTTARTIITALQGTSTRTRARSVTDTAETQPRRPYRSYHVASEADCSLDFQGISQAKEDAEKR
jgi:hypothetical protein